MLRTIPPTVEELEQVSSRFTIAQDSKPSDEQKQLQAELREHIETVAEILAGEVEPSRELSLTLTHLEEALMWAGKAIFK